MSETQGERFGGDDFRKTLRRAITESIAVSKVPHVSDEHLIDFVAGRSPGLSREIRKQLWLTHGCSFSSLYGDDGEMQCGGAHPGIDFKIDTEEQILRGILAHNQARMARAHQSVL